MRQFAIYALGEDVTTYIDCQHQFFYNGVIYQYSNDEHENTFQFIPRRGHRKVALETIKTISTYIRQVRWEINGRAIAVIIPTIPFPNDSHYMRCLEIYNMTPPLFVENADFDERTILGRFARHFYDILHKCTTNVLYPYDLYVEDTRLQLASIIYPDKGFIPVADFLVYHWFCQRIPEFERREQNSSDLWVFNSVIDAWVPETFRREFRYYLVRRNSQKRTVARFVQQHRQTINNLLWRPPRALMAHKAWRDCVALMEGSE